MQGFRMELAGLVRVPAAAWPAAAAGLALPGLYSWWVAATSSLVADQQAGRSTPVRPDDVLLAGTCPHDLLNSGRGTPSQLPDSGRRCWRVTATDAPSRTKNIHAPVTSAVMNASVTT